MINPILFWRFSAREDGTVPTSLEFHCDKTKFESQQDHLFIIEEN